MTTDISHSNLNLTSEEKRVYGQLFQQADSEKLGVVTGDVAVKFFERTKLDPVVLGEIWQLADTENRGLLTPAGFSIVLRLIGHCQAGREPSAELSMRPGPLPKFDQTGIPPTAPSPIIPTPTGQPQAASPPAQALQQQTTGPIRVPPLTADKVNEYSSLFEKAGARNGILAGDAAKQMFEKARLPNDALGKVWNLADTEQRGAFSMTEFVIAMHLLASLRTGALRALPQTLPAGLYEAASRRTPPAPVQAIPRQFTGQQAPRPQSPLSRPPFVPPPMSAQTVVQQTMQPQSTGGFAQTPMSAQPQQSMQPLSAQPTGADWLVSPQDKASFDKIFASIDRSNSGYIDGEQAVPFFSNSGLSEDVLATIWDQSDINSEGRLTRDEFAVAMYLIRQQRGKAEGRGSMATTLPPALIPPSMRKQPVAPSQSTAPAFDNAAFSAPAQTQSKSASDDLFGLDALASSPEPASQIQSMKPMAPSQSPPQSGTTSSSPRLPVNTSFKPFVPTSSFGQGLTTQNTGGSNKSSIPENRSPLTAQPSQQAPQFQPQSKAPTSAADDLLGDNDPVVSSKLTDETSELGNMSNQIGTLRNQMQEVQNKKISVGSDLGAGSSQKRELEARLAQFRQQYEQEVREVKTYEQQLTSVRNDTKRMQQELAMLEGTQADLQTQHQQVSTALDTDQRENSSLKERIRIMNETITQLKPQLEKLRSDARQQKGLVAINKKQVATSEGERDKISAEMNEVQRQIEEKNEQYRIERERTEREHRDISERLTADRERHEKEHRDISEKLTADRERHEKEHRDASERLKAEREQFMREKAEFQQEKAQNAAAERERLEKARMLAEQAEGARSAAIHAPVPQAVPALASPSASASTTNPFLRRSPEPQADRMMSPSVFSEEYGSTSHGNDAFDSFFGPSKAATTSTPPATSFRNDTHDPIASHQFEEREISGFGDSTTSHQQRDEPMIAGDRRQINSTNLPLRGLNRSESFSSSLRANPPASNIGVSGHASPLQQPSSPSYSTADEREFHRRQEASSFVNASTNSNSANGSPSTEFAHNKQVSHSSGVAQEGAYIDPSTLGTDFSSSSRNGYEGAEAHHGAELSQTTSQTSQTSTGLFATIASFIPGSHTDDTTHSGSPEHHSALETIASYIPGTQAHAVTQDSEHHSALETIASYIPGTQAHADATAVEEHRDDKESQYNHAQSSRGKNTTGEVSTQRTGGRSDEFPPIRELEDDDSASDDDEAGFGNTQAAGKQPARGDFFREAAAQKSIAPPSLNAQKSPPSYDQTVSPGGTAHDREANQFPPEFGGLLPSREIVSSPPAATSISEASRGPKQSMTPSVSQQEVPTTSSFRPNTGTSSYEQSSSSAAHHPIHSSNQQAAVFNSTTMPIGHDAVVPQAQEPGDDEFDSAFDDLSEAREFDEPTQDSSSFSRAATEEPDFGHDFDRHASRQNTSDSYYAAANPLPTPAGQPDGFIKVKQFTPFGAAVPAPVTPYAPSTSQQSPTASFSSIQQSPVIRQAPTSFGSQQPVPGPPSFSSHSAYAEPAIYSSSPKPNGGSGGSSNFGSSQFRAPEAQAVQRQVPAQAAQADDWDDLFSGLDNSNNAGSSSVQQRPNNAGPSTGKDPFTFEAFEPRPAANSQNAPAAPPRQAYAPYSGPPPPSQPPRQQQQYAPPPPQQQPQHPKRYSPPPSRFAAPFSTAKQQQQQPVRPEAPGRALSAGTEHDDPILKSLTSMGYKRDDALKALEKYDYNIDAAVDHLSRS